MPFYKIPLVDFLSVGIVKPGELAYSASINRSMIPSHLVSNEPFLIT